MRERGWCHSISGVRGEGAGVLCTDSSHGLASDDRAKSAIVFETENLRKSAVKEARIVKRKSRLQFHFISFIVLVTNTITKKCQRREENKE